MLQSVVLVVAATLTQAQVVDHAGDPIPTGALMRLGTIRWRHADHCTLAQFVGEGQSLVTGGYDGLVAQWSVPDGRRMRTYGSKQGAIQNLSVSPNGRFVAAGNEFKEIFVWDSATGQQLWTTKRKAMTSPAIRFSPDSLQLAIAGEILGGVLIVDAESGLQSCKIDDDRSSTEKICWSPDGKRIAMGMLQGMTSIYDVSTGRRVIELKLPEEILALDFSPDGSKLITVSGVRPVFAEETNRRPATLKIWSVESGEELGTLQGKYPAEEIVSVAYSHDGKFVAFTDQFEARLFGVDENGRLQEKLPLHGQTWVFSLNFSKDGRFLVGGSEGHTPVLWDLSTGKELIHETGHADGIISAAYLPLAKSLTSISIGNSMLTWELATGKRQVAVPEADGLTYNRISASGLYLVANQGLPDYCFSVRNQTTKTTVGPFATTSPSVSFNIDEQRQQIVSVGDYGMHLWDLGTKKKLWTSQADVPCHHALYANDRTQILTWSWYSADIHIVAATTGEQIATISTQGQTPAEGCIASDGRSLVVPLTNDNLARPSNPGAVVVYDLGTRKEVRRLIREESSPRCAMFCKRDQQILVGYSDGTVGLWNAKTGEYLKSFTCQSSVDTLLVHPSERSFAAICADTTILLWELPD